MYSVRSLKVNALNRDMRNFLADYVSDVASLPTTTAEGSQSGTEDDEFNNKMCAPGSTCRVAEDGTLWILNHQDEWVELPGTSGGSGTEESDSFTEITAAEIDEMF